MKFKPSYLLGLNELVGLAYVQNLSLLMKRAPGDLIMTVSIYTHLTMVWSKMGENVMHGIFKMFYFIESFRKI